MGRANERRRHQAGLQSARYGKSKIYTFCLVKVRIVKILVSLRIHAKYFRNGEELAEISENLTISSLGLEEEGNYSCVAVNSIGSGEEDLIVLEVTGQL